MWRGVVAVVLVAAACGTAAGCASATVGLGIPHQPSPSAFSGPRQDITGRVVVKENGCVDLDFGDGGRRWIIWPATVTTSSAAPRSFS